jgi:hypothetical protein
MRFLTLALALLAVTAFQNCGSTEGFSAPRGAPEQKTLSFDDLGIAGAIYELYRVEEFNGCPDAEPTEGMACTTVYADYAPSSTLSISFQRVAIVSGQCGMNYGALILSASDDGTVNVREGDWVYQGGDCAPGAEETKLLARMARASSLTFEGNDLILTNRTGWKMHLRPAPLSTN